MAEISNMNRAKLSLTYNGSDITADVAGYAVSFSYTDHEGGKADDLQVSFEDRTGIWKGAWFPSKGAILTAGISCRFGEKDKVLDCGIFAVDEVAVSGPPDTVELKAVSSFTAKALKREKKSRGWPDTFLEAIARQIAGEHGLTLFYQTDEQINYGRIDQRQESDLAFLKRLCDDHDLNLKISGEKLILFESKTMEQTAPVFSIVRGSTALGTFNFTTKTYEIFRGCEVKYWDPGKKTEHVHTFVPPDAPQVGQLLKVNQRAENQADAMAKARSMLRKKNRQEITGEMDLMGDPALLAGLTGMIDGFGVFDGKYIISEAAHAQDRNQGYRTSIRIRKVLNW